MKISKLQKRIVKFVAFKLIEIIALFVLILIFYNIGLFIMVTAGVSDLVTKCTYAQIGQDAIWCNNFYSDWLLIRITCVIVGIALPIIVYGIIEGIYQFLKWNWEMTK